MKNNHVRQGARQAPAQIDILVFEQDDAFSQILKADIEAQLPANVVTVNNLSKARELLKDNPEKYFLSVTSIVDLDSESFEKVDMLAEYNIPAIVIVDQYEDELRDQLIKRHVIDYVVKGTGSDTTYLCDLIARVLKNQSIKVLVIDDSKVAQFVIARELSLQKFEVIQVDNVQEAIEIIEDDSDIRLVLVDYQLKTLGGVEFVKKAREIYAKDEMSIIGISTSSDPRLAVKFLKAGANDFIAKPFNYEMMLCRINQNLDMIEAVDYAKQISNVDFLSNVFNRRYFFEQGGKLFSGLANDDVLTAMMIDVDEFKILNDQYGHDVGDEVVKYLAEVLEFYFPGDIVARLGGDEFAVLSLSQQYADSFDHIDEFRKNLARQTLKIKSHEISLTCSIGVTNTRVESLDALMTVADKLLYQAKKNGRNRVESELNILD